LLKRHTSSDDAAWDAYVMGQPAANQYHLSAWRRVIESSFGHRTHYLTSANDSGQINGVLPLVRVQSRLFGDFLVSLPFVNYGGPCADSVEIERNLVRGAIELARQEGVRQLEIRTEQATESELQVRSRKVSMRLPLPGSPDELWKALGSKLRNQIKRPERENVTIRIGRETELSAFYDVFALNMRDLGTPVYSKALFSSVLRQLPDSSWIVSAYVGETAVASGLLVGFRDMIEIPWASSLRSFNSIGTNVFLYWHLLKFSIERGYRTFDFGRSTPNSGPYRFKRQWGAQPVPLNWQYWVPEGAVLAEVNPDNPRFDLPKRIWQRLPVPLTRLIGPSIVRNIP
jgi:FemAB-related protein (PEP-CTERM system-associated)